MSKLVTKRRLGCFSLLTVGRAVGLTKAAKGLWILPRNGCSCSIFRLEKQHFSVVELFSSTSSTGKTWKNHNMLTIAITLAVVVSQFLLPPQTPRTPPHPAGCAISKAHPPEARDAPGVGDFRLHLAVWDVIQPWVKRKIPMGTAVFVEKRLPFAKDLLLYPFFWPTANFRWFHSC